MKVVLRLPDSWSNWNLKMLVFEGRKKREYSEYRREPTTNSTNMALTLGLNVKDQQKEKTNYINTTKKC